MTFDQLQEGDVIFLDANIFVYHFLGLSPQWKQLLGRCRNGLLQGKTASFILAETVHRLMIAEAIEQKLVTTKNALKKLREQRALNQAFASILVSLLSSTAARMEWNPGSWFPGLLL